MDDLISRQAAIDAMNNYFAQWAEYSSWSKSIQNMVEVAQESVEEMLMDMPSAQPERKKGKWMKFDYPWFQCSECGAVREQKSFLENYCPNCGADMRGEE